MATPTSYQRVNTATDYDTTAHSTYLRFDGSDDYMLTNSIDFTGTDKMTVFAGVRKLSDAALGMLTELSGSRDSNLGSFDLRSNTGGSWSSLSRGTASLSVLQGSTTVVYSAPETSVLVATHDISGDLTTLKRNTILATPATGDKGDGNFGNYPLYIGRRAGSSFPFNGRLYGLITRGATSTASEISNTENWMNQKTKAY
jgi:hypothetical protein